jgi:hypothetical protein
LLASKFGDDPVDPGAAPVGSVSMTMNKIEQLVCLETGSHRITGLFTLAGGGYRSRLSDALNAPEKEFVSLTDVTLERLQDGRVEKLPFMVVGRRHIVLAATLESEAADAGAVETATSEVVSAEV